MTTVLRTLYRTYGARGIALRATHELRRRARLYAADPRHPPAASVAPPPVWPFRLDPEAVAAATDRAIAVDRADRVAGGEYQAFGRDWHRRPRTPAEWNRHPFTGHRYPANRAWWLVPLLGRAGDVKDTWEPGRFGWVYDLIRGYAVTADGRYAEVFWLAVEEFAAACPPMRGVQWACGQETAIRAIALLWAEEAFRNASSTTPERTLLLQRLLHASGERIADAIGYAVSQRNNHGISEAVGLLALGARFQGGSRLAAVWLRRGRKLLPQLIHDQIADDGWYAQHSFTYARLAMDMLVIGMRVLPTVGGRLPESASRRVRAAAALLALVTDPMEGDVPNHGPNDGAHVLPLSVAGYRDFRPSITAVHATLGVPLPAGLDPSRETLAWLGTTVASAEGPGPGDRMETGISGWAFVRRGEVRVFMRAARYRGRPGHIDSLHVEIWAGPRPVAIDAGTFRYNAPPPWGHALEDERVHNTVTLPAFPMARRGPRFLWLSAPSASVDAIETGSGTITVRLSNHSWRRNGITHERTVEVRPTQVRITDVLHRTRAASEFTAELHWLCDAAAGILPVIEAVPPGVERRRCGDDTDVRGWHSRYYASREPAHSTTYATTSAGGQVRLQTTFDFSGEHEARNG